MVGTCALAQELGRCPDDHAAAFARYEVRMWLFVEKNQALIQVSAAAGNYGEGGEDHFRAALDDAKNAIASDA